VSHLFYIRETTSRGVLWWGPDRCGYTYSLGDAGQYTEEEAQRIERIRGTDVAYPANQIDSIAYRAVGVDSIRNVERAFGDKS